MLLAMKGKPEKEKQYFRVVEKFVSINGEGESNGFLSTFIRFYGCNLRCSYCDTKYSYEIDSPHLYDGMTAEEILQYCKSTGIKRVTLTGGEPLIQKGIKDLIAMLGVNGFRVEIETNGSIPIKVFARMIVRPVLTLDYKTASSGCEAANITEDNYKYLMPCDSVKFVVGSRDDMEKMLNVVGENRLTSKCHVLVSPILGSIDPVEIVDFLKEHEENDIRMQLQLHKYIWNPQKRGV